VFICANVLEHIFYLSAETKTFVLSILFKVVIVLTVLVFCYVIIALNDVLPRYKIVNLANKIGKMLFSDSNQIRKALTIESNLDNSDDLTNDNAYLDQTLHKLSTLNLGLFYPEATIQKWKSTTVALLMLIGVLIMFGWDYAAGSIYRWSHPHQNFMVPTPLSLQSISGDLYVSSNDDAEIVIKSSLSTLDSVYLRYYPAQDTTFTNTIVKGAEVNPEGVFEFIIEEINESVIYQAFVPSKFFWQSW
jgi:hypothetical protein